MIYKLSAHSVLDGMQDGRHDTFEHWTNIIESGLQVWFLGGSNLPRMDFTGKQNWVLSVVENGEQTRRQNRLKNVTLGQV